MKRSNGQKQTFLYITTDSNTGKSINVIVKKTTQQLQDRGYFWGRRVGNGKRERFKGLGLLLKSFLSF